MKKHTILLLAIAAALTGLVLVQGCGGGSATSSISGIVADINRNSVVDARIWVDGAPSRSTRSLVSGAYRLDGVTSGWRTLRAEALVDGEKWVGSTEVEVLRNQPTMNINIVIAPESEITSIGGYVEEAGTRRRIPGARVFLTMRWVYPPEETDPYDGAFGSIVAVTDSRGVYQMPRVPTGLNAVLGASKVGYTNEELIVDTESGGMIRNFSLSTSDLEESPGDPILTAIEAYTMPEILTRSSDVDAYRAVKVFASERFRKSLSTQKQTVTRATPDGSLIEVDLYFNALDVNDSLDVAGYNIYRAISPEVELRPIEFIRDPYANFYSDMGREITPYVNHTYAVSTTDVQFLTPDNRPDPAAESVLSNNMAVAPLGQLQIASPANGVSVSGDPVFQWSALTGAEYYTVYLYDRFPNLPLYPEFDYTGDPAVLRGVFPIWPRDFDTEESTVGSGVTSIRYDGPTLIPGRTYYWVVLAQKYYEVDSDNRAVRSAHSFSHIRSFTAR